MSKVVKPLDLRAIEARLWKIGETPWEFTRNNGIRLRMANGEPFEARIINAPEGDVVYVPEFPWSPDEGNAISEFIRATPEDVAALIAEVRRLRDALGGLGVMGGGYCWCATKEQAAAGHTGECKGAAAALGMTEMYENLWTTAELRALVVPKTEKP